MVIFPHGETNVTLVCQNKCISCNHFIPVQAAWYCDPEIVERDLALAAKVMHFDIYNLVGGEPTLHPELMRLIRIIRASGITNRIEITSNGQAYKKWPDEMYQEIDDMIITPYKLMQEDIDAIYAKCAQHNVRFEVHPVIFTWAAYKKAHDAQTAHNIYKQCWYNVNRHVIDEGYFYRCCTSPFIPSVLLGLPKSFDGIELAGLTEDKLTAYMSQDEPPASCTVCASNLGARIPWGETNKEQWIDESLG
jgi:cyclic pyranopterin phosphate synthase